MRLGGSNLNSNWNLIRIRGDLALPDLGIRISKAIDIVLVGFFADSEVDLKGCHPTLNQLNLTLAALLLGIRSPDQGEI